jgi:tRNA pseudouridine13 synthase
MTHPIITLPQVKLKTINADFVVDEIYLEPPHLPLAEATYTYLYVQKENLTTFQLQHLLANHFCRGQVTEVEASGLKDEQAVTRQIISIRGILTGAEVVQANRHFEEQGQAVEIRHIIGYGGTPVYRRLLHGNKFTITLRHVEAELAQQLIAYLQANKFFSFLNYYDEQRFGTPNSIHNTHRIGQALLAGDWERAYCEYLQSDNEREEMGEVRATFEATQSAQQAMQTIMPGKLGFFVSSYNSLVWNMALQMEVERLARVVRVELPWVGEIALPTDNSAALPASLTVSVQKLNWQTGQTSPELKQRPVTITVPVYLLHHGSDDLHLGYQALTVTFYLPTGGYATMLIKQMLVRAQL